MVVLGSSDAAGLQPHPIATVNGTRWRSPRERPELETKNATRIAGVGMSIIDVGLLKHEATAAISKLRISRHAPRGHPEHRSGTSVGF